MNWFRFVMCPHCGETKEVGVTQKNWKCPACKHKWVESFEKVRCETMREILFRGKRLDNGEWANGAFLNDRDGAFYICPAVSDITYGDNGNRRRIGCWYKVDPSTVGQYTGLKDKNGKRIFEGDKLKPFDDEIDKMVVEFHYGTFMLCLYGERGYPDENGEWNCEGNYGVFECEPLSSYGDDIEIIGNIHDNPELLGGTSNV